MKEQVFANVMMNDTMVSFPLENWYGTKSDMEKLVRWIWGDFFDIEEDIYILHSISTEELGEPGNHFDINDEY